MAIEGSLILPTRTRGKAFPVVPVRTGAGWSPARAGSSPTDTPSWMDSHVRSAILFPALRSMAVLAGTVMVLTSCALQTSPEAGDETGLTIDNCGTTVVIDAVPQRIVTVKSSTTELALALGAGDRIVAQAFADGPIPEQWRPERDIPVISDGPPSREAVLEWEPDLVFAGWESIFSADSAGDRQGYAALGIDTYVAPSACRDPQYQPERMTVAELESQIEEFALMIGADPTDFLAEQRAILDALQPDERGLTALWYSSGTDTPYVGAGIGNPQLILDLVGLTNVASDVDDTWTSMSWEAIVEANPDVIVLVDATWNRAADKITLLQSNAATAQLEAVRESRYLTIPFASTEAGARTAWAAADLASQLAALRGM